MLEPGCALDAMVDVPADAAVDVDDGVAVDAAGTAELELDATTTGVDVGAAAVELGVGAALELGTLAVDDGGCAEDEAAIEVGATVEVGAGAELGGTTIVPADELDGAAG